jgi:hypothetical protein
MGKQVMRALIGAALVLGLTMPVSIATAADRDYGQACHQRLQDAKVRIDRDAARHGPNSPQVDHDRARLDQARQWCRDHRADWDHSQFDVGIYLRK